MTTLAFSLVVFVFGLIIGAYLPLFLFYLANFIRGGHFGLELLWQLVVRTSVALFLFLMLFAAFGFFLPLLKRVQWEEPYPSLLLGAGLFVGFLGGVVLFVIGFRRGRRSMPNPPIQPTAKRRG